MAARSQVPQTWGAILRTRDSSNFPSSTCFRRCKELVLPQRVVEDCNRKLVMRCGTGVTESLLLRCITMGKPWEGDAEVGIGKRCESTDVLAHRLDRCRGLLPLGLLAGLGRSQERN